MEHTTSNTNLTSGANMNRTSLTDNTLKFSLPSHRLFRLDGDRRGTRILCIGGEIWVTQEGDACDHMLKSGDQFMVSRRGMVIVQGWPDGKAQISHSRR